MIYQIYIKGDFNILNIGLLCGGKSPEHEISIITMFQVKERILNQYNLFIIYMDKSNQIFLANNMTLKDFENGNYSSLIPITFVKGGIKAKKRVTLIDSMIILNHGMNGEDGMSSAMLELYDIPYVGSNYFASSILIDKANTHLILKNYDVPLVEQVIYYNKLDEAIMPFEECIIKPSRLGSSIGISIAKNIDEYRNGVLLAFQYDTKIVVERLLHNFKEYNIALYKTDKVYCSKVEEVKKKNEILTFDEKYLERYKELHHEEAKDEELIKQITSIAIKVYELFNLEGIVRMDFLESNGEIYFNECNTIPGALAMYLFKDFEKIIYNLIKYSVVSKNKKNALISTNKQNLFRIYSIKK